MDALVGAMGNLCPVRNAAPTSWRVLRHFGDVDDVVGEPTSRVRTVRADTAVCAGIPNVWTSSRPAFSARLEESDIAVPWTGFDLINAFNAWKTTEDAGRVFVVDIGGVTEINVTGLPWRAGVCQQVFEEAAVDCGRALAAWSYSGSSKREGRRVGPPRQAGVR